MIHGNNKLNDPLSVGDSNHEVGRDEPALRHRDPLLHGWPCRRGVFFAVDCGPHLDPDELREVEEGLDAIADGPHEASVVAAMGQMVASP